MIPHPVVDFDADLSARVRMIDILVIQLHGIDGLDKIRPIALDMYDITDVDRAAGQFDDAYVDARIIVRDPPHRNFSQSDGHGE